MDISKQINKKTYFYDPDKNKISVGFIRRAVKRKLKIGIVMDTAFSLPPTTGFTWRLYHLSKKLVEFGYELVWFLGNRNFTTEKQLENLKNSQFKIYVIPPKLFYNLKFLGRLIAVENPDILQYEITQTFLSLGVPLKKKNKIPVVLEIHDVEAVLRESLGRDKEVDFMEFLQFAAGHEAEAVVVFTPADKELLIRKIKVPEHKIYLAPIAISKEYSQNSVNLKENILLFLGNIFYPPNQEAVIFLIEKVLPLMDKKINNVKIKIVGGAPWELLLKYQSKQNVIFTGEVKDFKRFNKELGSSTVGLCTVFSGSGMKVKILNYCASGLPVIATPVGLSGYEKIKSLIRVRPKAADIARATIKVLKNKKMAAYLGQKNREMIFKEFSWDKTAREMARAYDFIKDSPKRYLKIPKPFWLEEKRHQSKVLPDCWQMNKNEIKKYSYEK